MLPVLQTNRCGSRAGPESLLPDKRFESPCPSRKLGVGPPFHTVPAQMGSQAGVREGPAGAGVLCLCTSRTPPASPAPSARLQAFQSLPSLPPKSPPEQLTLLQMRVQAGGSSGPAGAKPQPQPPLPCAKARRVFSSELRSKDRR